MAELYTWEGGLLQVDGGLAMDSSCCCQCSSDCNEEEVIGGSYATLADAQDNQEIDCSPYYGYCDSYVKFEPGGVFAKPYIVVCCKVEPDTCDDPVEDCGYDTCEEKASGDGYLTQQLAVAAAMAAGGITADDFCGAPPGKECEVQNCYYVWCYTDPYSAERRWAYLVCGAV